MSRQSRLLQQTASNHWRRLGGIAGVALALVLAGGCHRTGDRYQKIYHYIRHTGTIAGAFPDPKVAALVRAAMDHNTAKMRELVNAGANVNYAGKKHMTPLVWLMAWPNYRGVRALLALGANPNLAIPNNGNSPMTLAAARCDPKMLRLMLDYGGNPNITVGPSSDKEGNSALEMAVGGLVEPYTAKAGCFKNVELLVKTGANVNYAGSGLTAAEDTPSMKMVAYLLMHGYSHDLWGLSVVVSSRVAGKWKRRVIALLRKRGVAYPPLNRSGAFPSPPVRELLEAALDGDMPKLRKLIKEGVDPNYVGRRGWTPLTWERGLREIQRALLAVGADPNQTHPGTRYGDAPMWLAAGRCDPKTLSLMLAYGGNPNITGLDAAKISALEIAAEHFCTQNVELLVKHHANINYVDKDGGTAATKALAFKNFRLLARLLQLGYSHDLHDLAARVIATPAVPYKQPWKRRVIALLHQRGIAVPATSTAATPTTL